MSKLKSKNNSSKKNKKSRMIKRVKPENYKMLSLKLKWKIPKIAKETH